MSSDDSRQMDQPWLRQTAVTRQNDAFMKCYWGICLLAPLLLLPGESGVVVTSYVILGVIGLLLMGGLKLQGYGVKFCPACKAGNPIDADLCQRCGTMPATAGNTAP